MVGPIGILKEGFAYAWRGSFSRAGAWAPFAGALLLWFALWWLGYEVVTPATLQGGITLYLMCAVAAWLLIFIGRIFYYPYHALVQARNKIEVLEHNSVILTLTNIVFDPNGLTEMYADFIVKNPVEQTTIENWRLSILRNGEKIGEIIPRHVSTDKLLKDPIYGAPLNDDLIREPLESGGQRKGRLTFTVIDVIPKDTFGAPGTVFKLCARDIKNRIIEASYTLS